MTLELKYEACARIFPKLSAYGRAIEAGRPADDEYQALLEEHIENPNDLSRAIHTAQQFQIAMMNAGAELRAMRPHDCDAATQRFQRLIWLQGQFPGENIEATHDVLTAQRR